MKNRIVIETNPTKIKILFFIVVGVLLMLNIAQDYYFIEYSRESGTPQIWKLLSMSIIAFTVILSALISGKLISDHYWVGLLFLPVTAFIWWTVKDASMGYLLHENIFYISDTWPDSMINCFSGKALMIPKVIGLIFFGSFIKHLI